MTETRQCSSDHTQEMVLFVPMMSRSPFNQESRSSTGFVTADSWMNEWMGKVNDSTTMRTHSSECSLSDLDLLCFHSSFYLLYSSLFCSSNWTVATQQPNMNNQAINIDRIVPSCPFLCYILGFSLKMFGCYVITLTLGADGAVN